MYGPCNGTIAATGSTPESAATSCLAIKNALPSATSGTYWLDPDGSGSVAPFQTTCDMTTFGGGWTQVPLSALAVDRTNFSNDNKGTWDAGTRVWSCTGGPCGVAYPYWSHISFKITNGLAANTEMRVAGRVLNRPGGYGSFGGVSFDKQTTTTRNDYMFFMQTNWLQGTYPRSWLFTPPTHNFCDGATELAFGQPFEPAADGTPLSITRLAAGQLVAERSGTFYPALNESALFTSTPSSAGNTELRVLLGLQCVCGTTAGPDYPSVQLDAVWVRQ